MEQLWAVVLAAGEGKRMRSSLPKVLHRLCGRPMLEYVLDAVAELTGQILIVVGHGAEKSSGDHRSPLVLRASREATGHRTRCPAGDALFAGGRSPAGFMWRYSAAGGEGSRPHAAGARKPGGYGDDRSGSPSGRLRKDRQKGRRQRGAHRGGQGRRSRGESHRGDKLRGLLL